MIAKTYQMGVHFEALNKAGDFLLYTDATTHWVNLRLTIHARSSAIETFSGARTVHGKENANLPTL